MTFPPRLATSPVARPGATILGDQYRITVLADGLVRLERAEDGVFEDRASAFALHRDLPVPDFRVTRPGTGPADGVEIVTDRLRLRYDGGPFSASGLSVEVLGAHSAYHGVWRYGQRGPGVPATAVPVEPDAVGNGPGNLGGTARTLDEADGPVPLGPGVVSRDGWAVIDDSAGLVLDDDGWVAPRDGSRQDLYVFAYGHDYRAALRALYALSGPQPVLPRYALGTWWSRFHRYSADSYAELVRRFRREGVPLSVAVLDMDWHVTDVDPRHGSGWTGYSWNRDLFPDPAAFLRSLHDDGLRVTLNVHPADGVRAFEDAYPAMAEALGLDPESGEPVAFDATDRDFLRAYVEVLHRGLERDGVDFWWVDWQQGGVSRVPGIDPLWMLNHVHYLDNAGEASRAAASRATRALTFSRYAGPGSHRYPVGFSGDSVISWESLDFQPYFTATASNIGYGWWSHDVGGHMHGTRDDELATRWVQLGVFSPILRLHSAGNPFTRKEPWTFGPEARDAQVAALRLRHRLLPYLHTMNVRAARAGVPLVQPLYHEWPEAPEAYRARNQYLFGSELVVAPITAPADRASGTAAVRAWLPEGTWVDLLGGLVYDGGREVWLHRDLASIPVLARTGAVVPLDGATVPGNGVVHPEHVEVLVVVGSDGALDLVEDAEGLPSGGLPGGLLRETPGDPAHEARTPVTFDQAAGRAAVGPVQGDVRVVPAARRWTLTFPALGGLRAPADVAPVVTVDGTPADALVERDDHGLHVTVEAVAPTSRLVVDLGHDPRLADNDVAARVFTALDRARVPYDDKERAHRVLTADRPLSVRVSHLHALGLPRALESALTEILLARAPGQHVAGGDVLIGLSEAVRPA
ncbi:TIM-barrel domain-containing protein [Cellulosimicrobium sp. CpK407]|uniref:glycoside hydrolase family 31 protein n=1 Tax=Cellulosimicrobium sp. CpK407 TaxID=3229847 RepID=UPI003F2B3517